MAEVKSPSVQGYGTTDIGGASFTSNGHGGTARRIGEAAKQRVSSQVDEKKGLVVSQIDNIAEAFDEVARTLSEKGGIPGADRILTQCATAVRSFGQNIQNRSSDELISGFKQQVQSRPLPILLGCVALGFVGARMLREE